MKEANKILVYGAAGVQGGAVVKQLLKEGYSVQTIIRNQDKAKQLNEQGIDTVIGDLADPNSLVEANKGVSKVFLQIPVDFDLEKVRLYFHQAVEAAKSANVELLVVNTSVYVPDQITDTAAIEIKRELINYVKQSGIPYIVLQPTLYLENFYIPGVLANNVLAYPVPADESISWVSMEDLASFAVYALTHPELAGQTIQVCGPEALTGKQLAERFSQSLKKEVHFYSLPVEAFEAAISPLLGKETAAGLAGLYHWIAANTLSLPQPEHVDPVWRSAIHGTALTTWVDRAIAQGFFSE
ncbi:SDR family oxidoreductase [Paenibacillus eucommiae]|uniref:Uncharacterized protein YbjT (DUF2867 family) n=1 Tax=Paenibacillus eucommiae TaxID=1355755 RepID=A0ABS4IXL9_9BACL|nr:NmrA family NAD(P)-binding protein [Paenibacillus eucommiae]MBP1992330.1 uncharacterized protein YbjT (DUF2867 family) [Paenibacillus eucommiae]